MMRVPRTTGLPETLPGTLSIRSQAIQSISTSVSTFIISHPLLYRNQELL
jgi:hypothetical protein